MKQDTKTSTLGFKVGDHVRLNDEGHKLLGQAFSAHEFDGRTGEITGIEFPSADETFGAVRARIVYSVQCKSYSDVSNLSRGIVVGVSMLRLVSNIDETERQRLQLVARAAKPKRKQLDTRMEMQCGDCGRIFKSAALEPRCKCGSYGCDPV